MNATEPRTGIRHSLGVLRQQFLAIADEPSDDDDVRLRKRVAVRAGAILIVLPLQLPILGLELDGSWRRRCR